MPKGRSGTARAARAPATAQTMARKQREISISEFFTKNRHLLGFDSPAKALLTTIKEAVDNSLDACEEAGILPEILVEVRSLQPPESENGGAGDDDLDDRDGDLLLAARRARNGKGAEGAGGTNGTNGGAGAARNGRASGRQSQAAQEQHLVIVQDNGPGIVPKQVPRIFGKLLYGSKFHALKQSRGQQGIGISAAGMYGQTTTGRPTVVISRTEEAAARRFEIVLDTKRNEPDVRSETEVAWDAPHGTRVEIALTGSYKRGHHSVDNYLRQTAIANPHVRLVYRAPRGQESVYERASEALPVEAAEIKPHPYGVELGLLGRMLKETRCRNLAAFLKDEFCRVGPKTAAGILESAGLPARKGPKYVSEPEVAALLEAISRTRIPAPPTDCLSPIGQELIQAGLRQGVEADFHAAITRPPAVYRGNPFQIEVGLAYGGGLPADDLAQVLRFANRVPLLYQASACAIWKAILASNWRSYGLQQSRGALPSGPLIILVHIASVWVPFTSESKEAVAHYPEIVREIRLALQEAGRLVHRHIRRRTLEKESAKKQSYIQKYIPHIGDALQEILALRDPEREEIVTTLTDTLERSRKP